MTEMEAWLIESGVHYSEEAFWRGYQTFGRPPEEVTPTSLQELFTGGGTFRNRAIRQFGFAILTEGLVRALVPFGPLLEVGAGTGYWAWELARAGADVVATDPRPCSDVALAPSRVWGEVLPMTADQAIEAHGDRTLLVIWPSYQVAWPAEAIRKYRGHRIVSVDEGRGGCCADNAYFDELERHWVAVAELPMRTWEGIHDTCVVYERAGSRGPGDTESGSGSDD